MMALSDREKKVFAKLEKNNKELTEGQFNYELLSGAISNDDFDVLIEHIERRFNFLNEHPDSKKRFEIMKSFFQKLESDRLYDTYKKQRSEEGFNDAKKVLQGGRTYYDNAEKFRNSSDKESEVDSFCKLYAHSYERTCRLYFKPLAQAITKKKIHSCSDCIEKIIEYYPDIEFVLRPFIPHIRNSIDHVDFYYNPKEGIIIFEDRDKPPLELSIEKLRAICTLQTVSDVCISTADYALSLPLFKTSQYYFKKTEEYCKILQIDFDKIVVAWVAKGRNVLSLHNALEKMVKELKS